MQYINLSKVFVIQTLLIRKTLRSNVIIKMWE